MPIIGWDYNSVGGLGQIVKYPLPMVGAGYISITLVLGCALMGRAQQRNINAATESSVRLRIYPEPNHRNACS